ncbi:hypothetical protein TBLA_0A00390 [Henningerozyma blattae CBS 6284]|uniref:Elongin-C n=1 Tax=Henningerozyma blattae (strain ATCC 34711 / CBS 6284 / DSM 70876 / NBRC 10599 / NRRL Y-10934 / UCD 77-7) TaxID=1071380 RepID=I2GUN7_HENB6|nr:hypothetical protein TBLA_0A00390 [Tetrapisispora blattae CBS 6284]CCH57839.1 hypothetical protein TBLA_0A00390 [Tetrapisispora blattae CBS 6284]
MSDKEVILISKEGISHPVKYEVCTISSTIRKILQEKFQEGISFEIELKQFNDEIIKKVIEYMEYKYRGDEEEEEFEVATDMSLELLIAADYLDI